MEDMKIMMQNELRQALAELMPAPTAAILPTLRSSAAPGKSVSRVWSSKNEKSPISASVGDSYQG